MTKAIKQTLAAIGPRQAVAVGKTAPEKLPSGAVLLTFGKTFALQRQASNIVEALPGKIPAAVKALVESGGIVTAKVAKASGLDFASLVAKLQANKAITLTEKGKNAFIVTPKAKRADLIAVGNAAPAPAPKATKAAPAPKAEKKAKEAPKAAKATKEAPKPAKGAGKAPKAAEKAPAKAAKPAKAEKAAGKGKAEAPKGPVKGKSATKPVKAEKPAKADKKAAKVEAKADKKSKDKKKSKG